MAIFLSPSNRSSVITLLNDGTAPEEVEIDFKYGYPVGDSLGHVKVAFFDSVPPGQRSVIPWMRAFPRRLRLEPGQRQAVRVLVDAPAGLPPGEYWGRMMVHSRGGQPPVEAQQGEVSMRLELETIIAVGLTYRVGPATTGVEVRSERVVPDSLGSALMLDMVPSGNAAYRGRIRLELVNPDGSIATRRNEEFAVYEPTRWRFSVPSPNGSAPAAGSRIRYIIDTQRPDLPSGAALPAPERRGEVAVAVSR